ncbi:MAG: DNA photolyase [Sphaerochaetaceae bacterium]|nr:DNA photolyase [Sphaerochaetaceae bacterium]
MIDSIPFLSFQQKRILNEHMADLALWGTYTFDEIWERFNPYKDINVKDLNKNQVQLIYSKVISFIEELRNSPIDYSTFNPDYNFNSKEPNLVTDFKSPVRIMGKCPCPDESQTLRCCNLKTLDAVQQCAFSCSYCSIQSFYSKNEIKVISNLDQYLENLVLDSNIWHIGTGQSSDSLLLGDDYGTLTALGKFGEKHKDICIELKTKSSRTDWLKLNLPPNIVSTWSLNAPTVAQKEEHLASTIEGRIEAAKKCSEFGRLIGFHIHPMVYFTTWKEEYGKLVKTLCDNFDPTKVVMIGMGTLTFTKSNLRTLREGRRPTRVTQMPLQIIAGKYSYSFETKKQMFSHVFNSFPQDWKEKVFFYLCMEDKNLWEPCLGRSYSSNIAFEEDMKKIYFEKIHSIMYNPNTKYNSK